MADFRAGVIRPVLFALAVLPAAGCASLLGIDEPTLLPDGVIVKGPRLSSLEVGFEDSFGGSLLAELSPSFSPDFSEYSAPLPFATSMLSVFATAEPGARVRFGEEPGEAAVVVDAELDFDPLAVSAIVDGDDGENVYTVTMERTLRRVFQGSGAQAGDPATPNIDLQGDTLVVGVPGESRIRIFRRSPSGWSEEETTQCQGTPGEEFGYAVALFGISVMVGAPGRNSGNEGRGGFTLCYRQLLAPSWTSYESVTGQVLGARLGESVAWGAGFLAAGAPKTTVNGKAEAGAVHVRVLNGTTGAVMDGINPGDRMGTSIAMDDDILVMGAPGGNRVVFNRVMNGAFLGSSQTFTGDAPNSRFGASVALSDGTLLIGAPEEPGSGRVYAYRLSGAENWNAIAFPNQLESAGPHFGRSIGIFGTAAAVSSGGGTVHVFADTADGGWRPELDLQEPQAGDYGAALVVDAFRVLVGDPSADFSGSAAYAFFLYE